MTEDMGFEVGDVWADREGREYVVTGINPSYTTHYPIHAKAPDVAGNMTFTKSGQHHKGASTARDLVALVRRGGAAPAIADAAPAGECPGTSDRNTDREQIAELRSGQAIRGFGGYGPLASILQEAYDQSAKGKGHERHANGQAFLDQPIMNIARRHGIGFQFGQVEKKVDEAHGMVRRAQIEAAERELLGAIVYLAAAVMLLREQRGA